MQIKKPFYKINFEDIDIASEFFDHNQKHLSEFIMATIAYYSGKNVEIKSKLVEKYFKTYKKTMDFIMLSKGYGKKGALVKAENQIDSSQTLEGVVEAPLSETLPTNNKLLNINNKEVNIKDKIETFKTKVYTYSNIYSVDMLLKFFNYWSELNKSGTKMRFELEKTWEIEKRLTTWKNNGIKYDNPPEKNETQIKSMLQQRKEDAAKLLNNENVL